MSRSDRWFLRRARLRDLEIRVGHWLDDHLPKPLAPSRWTFPLKHRCMFGRWGLTFGGWQFRFRHWVPGIGGCTGDHEVYMVPGPLGVWVR